VEHSFPHEIWSVRVPRNAVWPMQCARNLPNDAEVYSADAKSHDRLVEKVLQRLQHNHLCASIKKSVFHASEVESLGYHISKLGIAMSPEKVRPIRAWAPPRSVRHVQQFLGRIRTCKTRRQRGKSVLYGRESANRRLIG
jgi:hypothetical protein